MKAVAVVDVNVHVMSLSYALQYSSTDGSGMRSSLLEKEGGALISAASASFVQDSIDVTVCTFPANDVLCVF